MNKLQVSLADVLSRAHQELREDLRDLEKAVDLASREAPAQMVTRLDGLRKHLTEHFRLEEDNGYLDSVRQRQPSRGREIDVLKEEHRQLALALDALLGEAREAGNLGDAFAEKVRAWVEQVRRHESHENRLVQEAFNQDISAED
jgi:hemerythrin-like domain-containing protein